MAVDFDRLVNRHVEKAFGEDVLVTPVSGSAFSVQGDFHRGDTTPEVGGDTSYVDHYSRVYVRSASVPEGSQISQRDTLRIRNVSYIAAEVTTDDSGWLTIELDLDR